MKTCGKCNLEKTKDSFAKRSASKDGLSNWCKECFKAYDRERYANGDSVRKSENKSKRINANRDYIKNYLKSNPCIDCGDSDWWNLDFDHIDPSLKSDGVMQIAKSRGLQAVLDEIAKCEVRCTKCHRRRTIDQYGWWMS